MSAMRKVIKGMENKDKAAGCRSSPDRARLRQGFHHEARPARGAGIRERLDRPRWASTSRWASRPAQGRIIVYGLSSGRNDARAARHRRGAGRFLRLRRRRNAALGQASRQELGVDVDDLLVYSRTW